MPMQVEQNSPSFVAEITAKATLAPTGSSVPSSRKPVSRRFVSRLSPR